MRWKMVLRAIKRVIPEVFVVFINWTIGLGLMGLFAMIALWSKRTFGIYPMLAFSLGYLVLVYVFVEVESHYRKLENGVRRHYKGKLIMERNEKINI
ncbi:MAG: hypothetical protein ACYCX4_11820 [Bacillota bacterium]